MELADGSQINASEVKVGDIIMSYNIQTGATEPSVVTAVHSFVSNNTYIFNGVLHVDGNEVMYINGKWSRASTAKVGDTLLTAAYGNVTIRNIRVFNTGGRVYDFLGSPVNDYIANGYVIDIQES